MSKDIETKQRMVNAEQLAARYLANANQFAEKGNLEKAERLYAQSQKWLDAYNKLARNG